MKKRGYIVFTLIFIMGFVSLFALTPIGPKWRLLGVKKVAFVTEKDVILVGAQKGIFKKIKLTVRKSGVHFRDLKVHFVNGSVMDVQIRKIIPAGGETRVIDLPGHNRYIKKVVFWYKSTKRNIKRATVRLFGRK
jgi:hypothetical protein